MTANLARLAAPAVLAALAAGISGAPAQESPTSLLPPALGQPQTPPPPSGLPPVSGLPPATGIEPGPGWPPPGVPGAVNPLHEQLTSPAPVVAPLPDIPAEPGGSQVLGTIPGAAPTPVPAPASAAGVTPAPAAGLVPAPATGPAPIPAVGMPAEPILPQAIPDPASPGTADAVKRIAGPLPAAALQRAARDMLMDRRLAQAVPAIVRAGALYALGFAEEAAGAAVEAAAGDVAGRALTAKALLAIGQREQACLRADLSALPRDAEPGPTFELLEILALCQVENGAADGARQVAGLLREQGGGDALFFALLDRAAGGSAGLPDAANVARLRPIHAALMRRAGLAMPASYAARAELALVPALMRDEQLASEARIAVAERAVEAGLAPPETLIGLYETTPLDEAMLMQATSGSPPEGALARAHLYALVAEAREPRERLGFILAMIAQGRAAGVGWAIAEAIGEDAAGLDHDPAFVGIAPAMVETLVRSDRAQAALAWANAAEYAAAGGQPALSRMAAHRLKALIAVAAPGLGLGVAAGALGADADGGALTPAERDFVAAEVAVMAGLGDSVPPLLAEIAGRPAIAPAGTGPEAVFAALAPLSGVALAQVPAGDLAAALAALTASGRTEEARRLGVEALVARPAG